MGTRPSTATLLFLTSLFIAGRAVAAESAAPEEVDALARRVPHLVVGSKTCPKFIARGSMPRDGYAYEIVSDGFKYRITIFDPDDGLPVIVGTNLGAVYLDLVRKQTWFNDAARPFLMIEPREGTAGTSTTPGIDLDSQERTATPTQFSVRPAVLAAREASTIEKLPDGRTRLTQRVDEQYTRIMTFAAPPSRNFRSVK